MRRALLLLASLAALAGCRATAPGLPPAPPNATRTMSQLISYVVENGQEKVDSKQVVEDLGFKNAVSVRRFSQEFTPSKEMDGEHILEVVVGPSNSNRDDIIWSVITIKGTPETGYFDGWRVRTDRNGRIKNAARSTGFAGSVNQWPIPIADSEVARVLGAEMNYFLTLK